MFYLRVCLLLFGLLCEELAADPGGSTKLTETTCECGIKRGVRIVNGKETEEHQYPFMVYVNRGNDNFCGGSIITSRHILTAAHCTQGDPSTNYAVVALHNWRILSPSTKVYAVKKFYNHPGYIQHFQDDDISIILLKKHIKFNQDVGRICLPTGPLDIENKQVTVMGWGRNAKYYKSSPDKLQHVSVKILSFDACSKQLGNEPTSNPKKLCSFAVDKSPCLGDSGGPLIWLDPDTNRYTQVSVNSYVTTVEVGKVGHHGHYNITCANENPTVSTSVSSYMNWIKKTIEDSVPLPFCTKKM